MEGQIDNLIGDFLGSVPMTVRKGFPVVDIAEYGSESVVVAELPGVRKEDLKIAVKDGVLTISGERKNPVNEDGTWLRRETISGAFSRDIVLPHDVDTDAISAELTNGMLRIVLPKSPEVRPREIPVR
jgi:HSP20 family protein